MKDKKKKESQLITRVGPPDDVLRPIMYQIMVYIEFGAAPSRRFASTCGRLTLCHLASFASQFCVLLRRSNPLVYGYICITTHADVAG